MRRHDLHDWRWEKDDGSTSSALVYLNESGKLGRVLREAELPLLQAIDGQAMHNLDFNRLPDQTVDNILGCVVHESNVGTLRSDSLGNPLFRPWSRS
jgi:hypothetical protein